MENNNWEKKYSIPNKLVKAPFASIVKKINDTSGEIINYDFFIKKVNYYFKITFN